VLFIAEMRELADGKPTGFKLCVGSRAEILGICKAMAAEDVTPDFIVVDGSEGGTGAAPLEFEDYVGMPLTDGLVTLHNALVGAGLRDRIKIGASGKVATGMDIVKRIAQGADYTNAARAIMMAIGCIQAQRRGVASFGATPRLLRQGLSRVMSRGKSVASRTLSTPTSLATQRSSPIANPPCGGIPCWNACRYPSYGSTPSPRSVSAAT